MSKDLTTSLASTQTRQHIETLIKVAQLYYEDGLNQAQIARQVGFSRSSVSRMLTEAREEGVVHISIGHPLQRLVSMENALKKKYGLKCVRVSASYGDDIDSMLVPQCGAALLMENLKPDSLSSPPPAHPWHRPYAPCRCSTTRMPMSPKCSAPCPPTIP